MRATHSGRAGEFSDPVSPSASTEVELQRALHAWCEQCEVATAALAESDTDGLGQALEARDRLRSRIEAMMARARAEGGASPGLLSTLQALGRDAAAADQRLTLMMETERTRLRKEIDTLRKGSGPVAAYRRPNAPNPHRLNIVR